MNSLKKLFSWKGLVALLFLALSFQIILPNGVSAQTFGESDTLKGVAEIFGVLISILTFIALLMMKFFGQLLGTNLLTGPDAMQAITPMWVWVRNLTNILFVVVLVGLAFTNLYSSFSKEGGGNWTIKEKLPKVIIALVAINFSLLGFRVVIDAINVGTVAILSIADSRLDTDNSELESAMIKDKTWVIVRKKVYTDLESEIQEYEGKVRGGDSCTAEHNTRITNGNTDKKLLGKYDSSAGENGRYYLCRDFRSQVNDLFCNGWQKNYPLSLDETNPEDLKYPDQDELDDDCLFILKKDTFQTMLNPDDEPGQNLFMSFGTTFMHLERLPALGAQINSLNGVIMNTLFSAILGLAYLVALVAVFIALLARVIVMWIALVFSPLLIAAAIMGFGQGEAGKLSEKLITHLVMPLKIAAAFAVSFVMMSSMIEFGTVGQNDAFLFGPALSNLGIGEYGFMWQMATIVIFWMAAKWAVEGSLAHSITEKIFAGAQTLGETAARSATIDRQIFGVGTGKNGKGFSMSNVMQMPAALNRKRLNTQQQGLANMKAAFGISESEMDKKIRATNFNSNESAGEDFVNLSKGFHSQAEFDAHTQPILARLALGTSTFARKFTIFANNHKGMKMSELSKKFADTNEGKIYFKDTEAKDSTVFDKTRFYTGTPGKSPDPKGGDDKNNEGKSAAQTDNVERLDTEKYKLLNEGDKNDYKTFKELKDAKKDITNGQYSTNTNGVKTFADTYYDGNMVKAATQLKLAGVKIAGIEAANLKIISTATDGKQNIVMQDVKDNNKVQAVYIADRRNGVPADLTKFGASNSSNGKIDLTTAKTIYNYSNNDLSSELQSQLTEIKAELKNAFTEASLTSSPPTTTPTTNTQ